MSKHASIQNAIQTTGISNYNMFMKIKETKNKTFITRIIYEATMLN